MLRPLPFLMLPVLLAWSPLFSSGSAPVAAGGLSPLVDVFPGVSSEPVIPVPDRIRAPEERVRHQDGASPQLIVVDEPAFAVPLSEEASPVVSLQAGDTLPIIEKITAGTSDGGTHFYLTLHPEVGLATVSTRYAAERLSSFPADWFELADSTSDIQRIQFAARPRRSSSTTASPRDEELLAIPEGEHLYPDLAVTIDLSTEVAGTGAVATFYPLSLRVEDITGDGSAELAIDSVSHTEGGSSDYDNETIETFYLTPNGGDPDIVLHAVHETRFDSSRIRYTHAITRNSTGTVSELRSYATREFEGTPMGVDKSVREYTSDDFDWIAERTRLKRIEPADIPAGLRDTPDRATRVTDWLGSESVVQPVDVHIDSDRKVWLKVDVENGASGWIEETEINWLRRR